MQVITTHLNADFDALASMVAAKKLYPDARPVFSGSQERNLREFFLHSTLYVMEFDKAKHIHLDEVDHLILVDVSSPERIGRFSEIVGRPGLKIHIYDHHPDEASDMKGDVEVIRAVGSTTTILVQILKERFDYPAEGLQAIQWFKEGRMMEIAEYCCYDVKLTKLVHEYGLKHRQLHYRNKFGKKMTVPVKW